MNFCSRTLAIAAGLACLSCPTALLAAEETSIEPVEKWSNVFSGGEVKFHYLVRTAQPFDGRLNWSLAFNERTIEHGQLPLTSVGAGTRYSGSAAEATVALKVPEVKEGVILESRLSIAAYAAGDPKPLATHVKTVWIFPREPFTDRSRWLQGLKITLFDPDGKTADVLEKARVPFTLTKNTAALGELREGLLVIGEGTAWRDYRSLGATIVKAAARGVPVLCLAPGEGTLALPGASGSDLPPPSSLTLRRDDIIRDLDNRLDAVAWPPDGAIDAARLSIKSDRDQVVAEAGRWPPPSTTRTWREGDLLPSPSGRGAGGEGDLLPSPSGRGAGGEGDLLPLPSGRGAGGEGDMLPSPSGRGAGGEGWSWLELRYPAAKGRLVICGFGIIRQWEATPAPRYLLSELLLRLTADKPSTMLTPIIKEP